MAAAFPPERCVAMIREAARRPDLDVEILATNAFAFSAQVASRLRDGRVILVGDAAHRMTPRGGRGMNTAIADAYDLGWKLAWTVRGVATEPCRQLRGGARAGRSAQRRDVDGARRWGGTADGLVEDLGAVVRSAVIVDDGSSERHRRLVPTGRMCPMPDPVRERRTRGFRSGRSASRRSTCSGGSWCSWSPATVAPGGRRRPRSPSPAGCRAGPERRPLVARRRRDVRRDLWPGRRRRRAGPAGRRRGVAQSVRAGRPRRALAAAVAIATGRGSDADRDVLGSVASAAGAARRQRDARQDLDLAAGRPGLSRVGVRVGRAPPVRSPRPRPAPGR